MNETRLRFFFMLVFVSSSWSAAAAETEPYYGWWRTPRDGTAALNRAINQNIADALRDVNRRADRATLSCAEVAWASTARLQPTAGYYFLGLTRSWHVDVRPASATEYVEEFLPLSIYRDAYLLPFGQIVPVDPAVRVGELLFGTDKIAHFFTNGARYHQRFVRERASGRSIEEAELAAIAIGIDEESGILGRWASGIFSYADLQANQRGLHFFRSLCEGDDPGLRFVDGVWVMRPFDIAAWVDPCWDEGYAPSAFQPVDRDIVIAAITRLCPLYARPEVQERRASYARVACPGTTRTLVQRRIQEGTLPDPSPFDIAALCGGAHRRR